MTQTYTCPVCGAEINHDGGNPDAHGRIAAENAPKSGKNGIILLHTYPGYI